MNDRIDTSQRVQMSKEFAARIHAMSSAQRKLLVECKAIDDRRLRRLLKTTIGNPPTMNSKSLVRLKRYFDKSVEGSGGQSLDLSDEELHKEPATYRYSEAEIVSLIFKFIEDGYGATRISEILGRKFRIDKSREAVSRAVWDAVRYRQLRYIPEIEDELSDRVKTKYGKGQLREVKVCNAANAEVVAAVAAERLCILLGDIAEKQKLDSAEIEILFGSGRTPGYLLEHLAKLLANPSTRVEKPELEQSIKKLDGKTLVFQSLTGAMPEVDPAITPSSYFLELFGIFVKNELVGSSVKTKFRSLPFPGIVTRGEEKTLNALGSLQVMKEKYGKPRVIVTSAGHFGEGCRSAFPDFVREGVGDNDNLRDALNTTLEIWGEKCVGDLLWKPIDKYGEPVEGETVPDTTPTVMTLLGLDDVRKLVEDEESKTSVLLVMGPCGGSACQRSKAVLLKAILSQAYTTHLICDSRSVNEMLNA